MHNNLLSTAEVADLLRVSASTVSRMATRGDLQYQIKAPGKTGAMLFDPAVISAYVAEQVNLEDEKRSRAVKA